MPDFIYSIQLFTYKVLGYVNFEDITNPAFIFQDYQPLENLRILFFLHTHDIMHYYQQSSIKKSKFDVVLACFVCLLFNNYRLCVYGCMPFSHILKKQSRICLTNVKLLPPALYGPYHKAVKNQWNGMVEWNTGMEYWNGILEWVNLCQKLSL